MSRTLPASVSFAALKPRALARWSGHVPVSRPWDVSESTEELGTLQGVQRTSVPGPSTCLSQKRSCNKVVWVRGCHTAEACGVCLQRSPVSLCSILPSSPALPGLCCKRPWCPPQRESKSWAESNRSRQPPGRSRSTQVSGSRDWDPMALPLTLSFSRSFPGERVNKLLCRSGQLGLASCYLPQRELWGIHLGSFSPNWSGDSNKEGLSRVSLMRNCFHIHHFIPPS